jgi:hypothetical protein
MKRTLLVVALVVISVAPSFAYGFAGANLSLCNVEDFGWGICANDAGGPGPSFMLMVFPGDDWVGSVAWTRANIVMQRLRDCAPLMGRMSLGQIMLAKDCCDVDYSIVVEGCVNGQYKRMELVTVDSRLSKPYGACNKQLGTFWLKRIKALAVIANNGPGPWIKGSKDTNDETALAKALLANWRWWRGVEAPECLCPGWK